MAPVSNSTYSNQPILQIECLKNHSEIISYLDDNDRQEKFLTIVDRITSLYTDYFTLGGHQKLLRALKEEGYIKDIGSIKQETMLCFDELIAFKETFKRAVITEFHTQKALSPTCRLGQRIIAINILQKDLDKGLLGKVIRTLEFDHAHPLIYTAFFPLTRSTQMTWYEEKKEFKVTIITPKPTGVYSY